MYNSYLETKHMVSHLLLPVLCKDYIIIYLNVDVCSYEDAISIKAKTNELMPSYRCHKIVNGR